MKGYSCVYPADTIGLFNPFVNVSRSDHCLLAINTIGSTHDRPFELNFIHKLELVGLFFSRFHWKD